MPIDEDKLYQAIALGVERAIKDALIPIPGLQPFKATDLLLYAAIKEGTKEAIREQQKKCNVND